MLHIVLVAPEIPPNTGNIARLCAAMRCKLHLIEPLGFELTDRYLKRAGLDYWSEVDLVVHKSWEAFQGCVPQVELRGWVLTTHASTPYQHASFEDGDVLIFGNESSGLPDFYHRRYAERRITIPMRNKKVRSLNLSSAVAVVVCEALRQLDKRCACLS